MGCLNLASDGDDQDADLNPETVLWDAHPVPCGKSYDRSLLHLGSRLCLRAVFAVRSN